MPENKSSIVMAGRQASANLCTALDQMAVYMNNFNACGYGSTGTDPILEADLTPPAQYGSQSQPISMADWEAFLYAANVLVEGYAGGQNAALNRVRP